MSDWPKDPQDGMIFEKTPGVFFQYDSGTKSWVRLDGYKSIELATALAPGLMSSEDYAKINQLLIPPPQITLSSDQCGGAFEAGQIGLFSNDESLFIEDTLDLIGQDGEVTKETWHLHENTYGFNFRVNIDKLVEELEKRGNIHFEQIQGPKGDTGEKGDPGIDKLDTGPKGPTGEDGQNAPFAGDLVEESIPFEITGDPNRAVIKVEVESISKDENYLVITRGLIGNPDACPDEVNVQLQQSPWVLALDFVSESRLQCDTGCPVCATLFYLDFKGIEESVYDRYVYLLNQAKVDRENKAREWLMTMMKVFNDQKAALCCALENCESRKRNQDERRYIEQQRVQGALSNFKVTIDGDMAATSPSSLLRGDNKGVSLYNYSAYDDFSGGAVDTNKWTTSSTGESDLASFTVNSAGDYGEWGVVPDHAHIALSSMNDATSKPPSFTVNSIEKGWTGVNLAFKWWNLFPGANNYNSAMIGIRDVGSGNKIALDIDHNGGYSFDGVSGATGGTIAHYEEHRFRIERTEGRTDVYFDGALVGSSSVEFGETEFFCTLSGWQYDSSVEVRLYGVAETTIENSTEGTNQPSGGALEKQSGEIVNNGSKVIIDMDSWKDCDAQGGVPGGEAGAGGCDDCVLSVEVDANNMVTNPVIVDEFPAGLYMAEIQECCIYNRIKYSGETRIQTTIAPGVTRSYLIPEEDETQVTNFQNNDQAAAHYNGSLVLIEHGGGEIRFWFAGNHGESGSVKICLWNASCFIGTPVNIGFEDFEYWCIMSHGNISWHERTWKSGSANGALVDVGGTQWIVVRPNLSDDVPCIRKFEQNGFGKPALAWQTSDGNNFLGLEDSDYALIYDEELNDLFKEKLEDPIEVHGDISDFDTIIFPHSPVDVEDFFNPGNTDTKILIITSDPDARIYDAVMSRLGLDATWQTDATGYNEYNAIIVADSAGAIASADALEVYVNAGGGLFVVGNAIYFLAKQPGVGSMPSWLAGGGVYQTVSSPDALTADMVVDLGTLQPGDRVYQVSNGAGTTVVFDPDTDGILAKFNDITFDIPGRDYNNEPPQPSAAAYRRQETSGRVFWCTTGWNNIQPDAWTTLLDEGILWAAEGI